LSIRTRLVEYGDGNTLRAFSNSAANSAANPAANDTERGTVYDAQADKRS